MENSYPTVKVGASPTKSATLRDVAERAGVSVATASRVLSGSAVVRPATRARVERAMRDLLYVAPGRAEPSGAIGLLVPEFGNPVFATLAQAMETRATAAGYATILCNTAGTAMRELDYVHMLLERRVEGMVFISSEITDVRGEHSHYAQLLEQGARLVFVNGGAESLPVTSVGVDEQASGRIATEYLLTAGSASSPATSSRSRRGRRRAGGRTPSAPPGSTPHATSRTATSRWTAAAERSTRSSTTQTATARPP